MITFIKEKRKILISVFLSIGILSALVDGIILAQRPQTYKSKAATSLNQPAVVPENIIDFTSPLGLYKLSFDTSLWVMQKLDERIVFNLNQEYGFARLDIIEGQSDKTLEQLITDNPDKIEPTQFQGKPALLVTYKEQIAGEEVYFYKQIVKEDNKFLILEKRVSSMVDGASFLDNLVSSISFSDSTSPKIKGVLTASADLTTVQLVDLIRPSVASIVYVYCLDIVNLSPNAVLAKPKYNFCGLSKGSGFIVSEQGIVATNGHVVRVYPEEGLVVNLLNAGSKVFSSDLIRGVYLSKGQNLTQDQVNQVYQDLSMNPQYLDRFLKEIFDLINKKILSVATSNERYYINVGNEPVKIDYQKLNEGNVLQAVKPSSTTYTAKLIDFDYPNKYSYEAVVNKNYHRGADVALLRIEDSKKLFPALELGSIENLTEGSDVVVAGYPVLVEGNEDPQAAISYKTSTKPTITRGIVSAIKQDLTGKTIIQTDASIDRGNSGGAGFNSSGQVIGIVTFMAESKSGNFNFLRDVTELKSLMSKNNIANQLGDLTNHWRQGLSEFRAKHFQKALKYFQQVENLSPSHPTVKELMRDAKEAIAQGESLEGMADFIKGEKSNLVLLIFGSISMMSFMSAGFLLTLPLFTKKT